MPTVAEAQTRVYDLVIQAKRAGADAADSLYACSESTSVSVRLGELEDVERSEGETIGLRLFVGQRSASVSSSDLSADALAQLVERAIAMAREAPEDAFAGLAPEDRLLRGPVADVDGDDRAGVAPEALRARAVAAENAARSVAGITNSEGASASHGRAIVALATSHGFIGGYATSGHGCSASVIAGEGSVMQRDYAHRSARHLDDLEDAQAIGRRAGERTVARMNPTKLTSGAMPILFDPRVGSSLLGHFAGAITGSSIARRTSFLLDALGTTVFAPGVTIVDDPLRPRGLGSKPFDGEGLPTARRELIAEGVLTGWLLDAASARQLGLQPTGNAQRGTSGAPGAGTTNLYMAAGTLSPTELMSDVKRGFYVTELIGQGVNPVTGDYSRGAAGFLIEDGKIGPPVAEITIAGNLREMFRALVPADDLRFERATDVPTIRIDGMTIAGA
jgi:PmbA protein